MCGPIFRTRHFLKNNPVSQQNATNCNTRYQETAKFATKHNIFITCSFKNSKNGNKMQHFFAGCICYMRNPIPSLAEKYSGKAVKFAELAVRAAAGIAGFCSLWLL